jgi:AraC-like DNA-binding protein
VAESYRGLPVIDFDESSIPGEHHFEVFHDSTAPLFDTAPLTDETTFRCTATDYLVDDLVVSRLRYDAQALRRPYPRVSSGESDWITLQVYTHGGLRGHVGEESALELDATRVGIVDLSHMFAAWSAPSDVIWVGFPRHRLECAPELAASPGAPTWARSSARGRALAARVADLWRSLPEARAEEAPDLADGITETVNRILRPGDLALADHDLRLAMRDHIAANLDDLDLDVDTLRAVFHCSRSSIYRVFEEDGGVARHIREQRLLRCFDELARPAKLPRRVSHVATRWGFENPSHFHRLFTQRFGLAPSALNTSSIRHPRPALDDRALDARVTQFHDWARST